LNCNDQDEKLGGSVVGFPLALVIAPATLSNTARAGGVLFPILRGLTATFNSEPGPTAGRIGRFLMLNTYQGDVITSGMFISP
jgi:DASS family divalent anion:Na+ symporter